MHAATQKMAPQRSIGAMAMVPLRVATRECVRVNIRIPTARCCILHNRQYGFAMQPHRCRKPAAGYEGCLDGYEGWPDQGAEEDSLATVEETPIPEVAQHSEPQVLQLR